MLLRDGPAAWNAIAFNQAESPLAERVDIVYSLQQGWRGDTVELEVLDIAPSDEERPLELD
ncbi:MAG: hypothetical protein U5Q44_08405 [Dehalococcoidia bacterium]|nr:hypothetical protein [Dehalococcoidia bacterium]